jgi:hypothetical protein
MAMFSKRPASLAHLTDEEAARVLSKRFGDVVKAARDLGVDRKILRRLIWSNPAILAAAHERQELFIIVRRDELMGKFMSKVASVRDRAAAQLCGNPVLREPFAGAGSSLDLLTPAPRVRKTRGSDVFVEAERAHAIVDRELAAERDMERAAEREREAAAERAIEQGRSEVMVERRPPAPTPAPPTMSLWPAHIRRPTRGRRW